MSVWPSPAVVSQITRSKARKIELSHCQKIKKSSSDASTMVASTTTTAAPSAPTESASANLASSLASGENSGGSNSRLSNTTACLPFVYGSVAFFQGKKADEYHTHKWTLYLRGANDEDLSGCISKVVFQLHPSFTQPVRELSEPPFEVTERGWGEFEAQIRIIWKDPQEKATVVSAVLARWSICIKGSTSRLHFLSSL